MRRALEGLEGVTKVSMRFDDTQFDVDHDGNVTSAAMIAAVDAAGFKAWMVSEGEAPIDVK